MNEELGIPVVEQKESIKLTKNTRGYGWEIRIIESSLSVVDSIKRLEELDNKLKEKFERGLEEE